MVMEVKCKSIEKFVLVADFGDFKGIIESPGSSSQNIKLELFEEVDLY
jgi:hypothetical protein